MNNIAANIKNLRKEKGLSQEEFAQALHVTRQTVSAWERGLSRPGLEALQQMAEVLDVAVEGLLYGEGRGGVPAYRKVSFLPVLSAVMLFYLVSLLLPFLGGQVFIVMAVMFCYCSLKDEIRNAEYYKKHDPEDELEEWKSDLRRPDADAGEGKE